VRREGLSEALPSYEIGDELGRGAMGEVYAARHTRLDRDVAVKQLPEGFARDEEVRDRFGDEARVLASLTHPHIVPVYDYVEEEGVCLLVMEALPGGTVWDRFTTDGLSMPTACAVALATCAGLAYAHEHRVLHRDIKPENLMFDAENTLKVTDFGIATVLGGDDSLATGDGEIIGTPAYMAPEQAEGGEIGPAADVYAVGTMLYELLSGRLPFDESGDPVELLRARTEQAPLPLAEVAPGVPAPLVEVTMRAIAPRPEDRYAGPEELGVAVVGAADAAWGPSWKDHAELRLLTGGAFADAARAPVAPAPTPTVTPGDRTPVDDSRETIAPGDTPTGDGRETIAPGDTPTGDSRETIAPGDTPTGDGRETIAPGAADLDAVMTPSDTAARRSNAADLVEAAPDDLVQVADVLKPPDVPWWGIAAGVVLTLAMVLVGLTGLGEPDRTGQGLAADQVEVAGVPLASGETVEVDLTDPIAVLVAEPPAGTTRAELALSAMGIPLGTSDAAEVQAGPEGILAGISASALRVTTSGPVTAELRLLDDGGAVLASREFALDPDRPGHLSLAGVIAIILVLFVLAYGASSSARLRKGRRDRSAYPKLAVVGVLAGVAVTALGWSFLGAELTLTTLVVAALLGGAAAVVAGVTTYRLAVRRRLRRIAPAPG
jgi:serine/threonine-protein kinase